MTTASADMEERVPVKRYLEEAATSSTEVEWLREWTNSKEIGAEIPEIPPFNGGCGVPERDEGSNLGQGREEEKKRHFQFQSREIKRLGFRLFSHRG